ncbi:hypothetical protein BaRGS_00038946 [Batillaria attramentaria]|uniref:Uncharacterized protein n=1 Tax=Batillaria attramentaria TaxID=370345 RepID=A0ABD0J4R4_9CAEN
MTAMTVRFVSNRTRYFLLSALPRPCLRPALPDSYLHPSVSAAVKDGSDDTTTVAPFYGNSILRSAGAEVRRSRPTPSRTAQKHHVLAKSCAVSEQKRNQAMASPRMTTVRRLSSLAHNARNPRASTDTVPHGDQEDDNLAAQPRASNDCIPMSRRLPQTAQIASDYVPMHRKNVGKPHKKVQKPSDHKLVPLRGRDTRHTPRVSDKASGYMPMSRKAARCLRKEAEKSCDEEHVPLSRMRVKYQPKDEQEFSDSEMSLQREKKAPADDYLTPTVSRAVTDGKDTVRNNIPV